MNVFGVTLQNERLFFRKMSVEQKGLTSMEKTRAFSIKSGIFVKIKIHHRTNIYQRPYLENINKCQKRPCG